MSDPKRIYDALVMLSVAMGTKQEPVRLKIYTENLKEFDAEIVVKKIESFSRTAKFFPQISEIIEVINGHEVPTDELAITIANEILHCAERFAAQDVEGARNYLGDKFQIAESFGWVTLTRLEYSDLPATRAQLRELAKAYINRSKREGRNGNGVEFKLNTITRNEPMKSELRPIRFTDD